MSDTSLDFCFRFFCKYSMMYNIHKIFLPSFSTHEDITDTRDENEMSAPPMEHDNFQQATSMMISGCPQQGVLDWNLAMGGCRLIQALRAAVFWFGVPRDSCYSLSVNSSRQVAWAQTTPRHHTSATVKHQLILYLVSIRYIS